MIVPYGVSDRLLFCDGVCFSLELKAVQAALRSGGAVAGLATMDSSDPVGQESALVGAGLVWYNLALGGTKTIPVRGKIVSVGTGIWDIFGPHGAVNHGPPLTCGLKTAWRQGSMTKLEVERLNLPLAWCWRLKCFLRMQKRSSQTVFCK